MRLRIVPVGILLVSAFMMGIGGTTAFNLWRTEGSKEPAVFDSGAYAGVANPADIRGSYTFGDIAAAFPVPSEALGQAFGVPSAEAAGFQVKGLETLYAGASADFEIGTDSVRWFVALYAGLPFEPGEGTGLPASALSALAAAGRSTEGLAPARMVALSASGSLIAPNADKAVPSGSPVPAVSSAPASSAGAVPASPGPAPAAAPKAEPASVPAPDPKSATSAALPEKAPSTERLVKGSTTFAMLEDWGLSRERVTELFGGEIGPSEAVIRDWLAARGLEFSTYKVKLQAELDALD